MKKTININDLKDRINNSLKSIDLSLQEKSSLANLLEAILHETGNYKGFMFLNHKEGTPTWEDYTRKYF